MIRDRDEESILVVAHSLTLSYLLGALEGLVPVPKVPLIPYAIPYGLTAEELDGRSACSTSGLQLRLGERASAGTLSAWGFSSGSTSTSGGTS